MKIEKLTKFKTLLKKKEKPEEIINNLFLFLGFKDTEIKLYNLLLSKQLTMKQIKEKMDVTERTIRENIKSLSEKQLIIRKVVTEDKRLKYVYSSVPITKAWQIIKSQIRKTMKKADKVLKKGHSLH